MPTIAELVTNVDQNVEDLTEVRVFALKHADPTEMATLLGNLFPDQSTSANATQMPFQFGRFGPFGGGGGGGGGGRPQASSASEPSDRMKLLGHVTAVADNRTASVVVSASKGLMPQIAEMITQLDESSARQPACQGLSPEWRRPVRRAAGAPGHLPGPHWFVLSQQRQFRTEQYTPNPRHHPEPATDELFLQQQLRLRRAQQGRASAATNPLLIRLTSTRTQSPL